MRRSAPTRRSLPLMRSLRNRLALLFFAITLVAIAALYLYVAPGLRSRLINERLDELAAAARHNSSQITRTVGSTDPASVVRGKVDAAALASGDRVTLLLVSRVRGGLQLSALADSSKLGTATALPYVVAYRAARSGDSAAGTEPTRAGTLAEAAAPFFYQGRPVEV